jgi:rubrerythrin
MSPKSKTAKPRWKCRECGKPTSAAGKICMVCKTEDTLLKGNVKKKTVIVAKAKNAQKARKAAQLGQNEVREPGMCEALSRALDLEVEGRRFYLLCAGLTRSEEGKDMFNYLAHEEKVHYDKIAQFFEVKDFQGYCDYVEAKGLSSGVFDGRMKGVKLDDKADSLDALNVAIKAEENSIDLYSKLANEAGGEEMRLFFERLVGEERKHRNILETEVEYVTGTGDFKDFRAVTM